MFPRLPDGSDTTRTPLLVWCAGWLGVAVMVADPGHTTWIRVRERLRWNHFGDPKGLSDWMGGTVHERAEVALLSRNIIITGASEGGEARFEGGHFVIHQTATPQVIEGVEFVRLGQQGKLGRYSLHWHACGDTKGRNVVRKNSIHDSHQVQLSPQLRGAAQPTSTRCS